MSPTYQWFKGFTSLVNGATGTGSTIAGATTATLNITNVSASDNATDYRVIVTNTTGNSCQATSNNVSLTVAPLEVTRSTATGTSSVSSTNMSISDASCNLIARVNPSGALPVSGNVTATVTFDASQPNYMGRPYLIRHYDISPATNPSNVTATLTLYFLQSEFNTYNAAMSGTANDLPTGPLDAPGIANLRITQMHGSGTAPGNYSGFTGAGPASVLINPADNNIVWNSTRNWWEVTFNVTGFSGFYVTGLINFALPIRLENFSGNLQGNNVQLSWVISEETNVSYYEVEMSEDGVHFTTVKKVTATNNRNYSLLASVPGSNYHYYRLKIIDNDGRFSYSNIIALDIKNRLNALVVSPNPFHEKLVIDIKVIKQTNTSIFVTDISGKVLLKQQSLLTPGTNSITLNQLKGLTKGTYMLHVVNDEINTTVKIIKGE